MPYGAESSFIWGESHIHHWRNLIRTQPSALLTAAVRNGLANSFAFRSGAGGPIQSILKLKASTLGSSFLPSTPGVLGGGGHGALFMGVDSFINQREIAARGRWGPVDVFVTVSRGDCLRKVSAASVELSLQPSSKERATQFSICLIVHSGQRHSGTHCSPPEMFKCFT